MIIIDYVACVYYAVIGLVLAHYYVLPDYQRCTNVTATAVILDLDVYFVFPAMTVTFRVLCFVIIVCVKHYKAKVFTVMLLVIVYSFLTLCGHAYTYTSSVPTLLFSFGATFDAFYLLILGGLDFCKCSRSHIGYIIKLFTALISHLSVAILIVTTLIVSASVNEHDIFYDDYMYSSSWEITASCSHINVVYFIIFALQLALTNFVHLTILCTHIILMQKYRR